MQHFKDSWVCYSVYTTVNTLLWPALRGQRRHQCCEQPATQSVPGVRGWRVKACDHGVKLHAGAAVLSSGWQTQDPAAACWETQSSDNKP